MQTLSQRERMRPFIQINTEIIPWEDTFCDYRARHAQALKRP